MFLGAAPVIVCDGGGDAGPSGGGSGDGGGEDGGVSGGQLVRPPAHPSNTASKQANWVIRIEQKLCEECAISEPRKKMKEDRSGGGLGGARDRRKGFVGVAMAQRKGGATGVKFQKPAPKQANIRFLVNKCQKTGNVADEPRSGRLSKPKPTAERIREAIERSPQASNRRPSNQLDNYVKISCFESFEVHAQKSKLIIFGCCTN
ncbi:hypothetical protein ANN_22565 [Periplaneta americana]|uniref:Uncharacterized protein n=1 Tax=Periplaneta americana TaxID=6978 RepID=A0ABQ8S8G7_PERAM|nr:hypothetical protein ANN_22565 [Periplaneta americana]